MKIDRFVKVMLVLIALLLVLNCARGIKPGTDANSNRNGNLPLVEPSADAAPPPTFIEVGKTYRAYSGTDNFFFKVDEVMPSGWVRAQQAGNRSGPIWVNISALSTLELMDPPASQ